jgi:excisionase family DNA binding protein
MLAMFKPPARDSTHKLKTAAKIGAMDTPSLLSPLGVATLIGVSRTTAIKLIEQGSIPAFNVGSGPSKPRYRIRSQDVEDFISSRSNSFKRPV